MRRGRWPRRLAAGRTASAPPAPIAADAASPIATYMQRASARDNTSDLALNRVRPYHTSPIS